jgi:hypothetical protein
MPVKTCAIVAWARTLLASIEAWATTCADYFSAATLYEELSKLSNAEIEQRGMERSTLARDLCEMLDRSNHRSRQTRPDEE